jgi:hypothetical protein
METIRSAGAGAGWVWATDGGTCVVVIMGSLLEELRVAGSKDFKIDE